MNLIYHISILIIVSILTIFNFNNRFLPGPTGSKGEKGDKGNKGTQGPVGAEGERGKIGFDGIQGGNDGIKGSKGLKGLKGDKGEIGNQGFPGEKGLKGYDGLKGKKGLIGDIGLPGLTGLRGDGGEYLYTKIDLDSCKEYSFDNDNLELKCPFGSFLTKIDLENKKSKCCKLMLDTRCNNNLAKLSDDDENDEVKKSIEYFGELKKIFYLKDYICDENYEPSIEGDVNNIRCCKKEEDNDKPSYKSYNVRHHRSDRSFENLINATGVDNDNEKFYNDIKSLKNYYIKIPDFSGDTFYTFNASDYGNGLSYKQLRLRDPDGNKPVLPVNRNYIFNVYYSKDSFTYLKLNIV